MNDLKNNEIRIIVTAVLNGEHYDRVDVFAECGDDFPQEERNAEVVAIMSTAAAGELRDSGAPIGIAESIMHFAIQHAYAQEVMEEEEYE